VVIRIWSAMLFYLREGNFMFTLAETVMVTYPFRVLSPSLTHLNIFHIIIYIFDVYCKIFLSSA